MNFNLLSQLSKEDKEKIEKYIYLYGTKENFIGVDNWLKYWSTNKIKMFKLLNNQLIYRTPFEYVKSQDEIDKQIADLVQYYSFPNHLFEWLHNHEEIFPSEVRSYMNHCCTKFTLMMNEITDSLKFKLEGNKKILQFQKGIKPLRAISRFLTYCKDVDGVDKVTKSFEIFRLAHSVNYNDKIIKGNIVISIHPLDFMTMSDNNSNWHSCMSWAEGGCYRVGTVEMMNSNNVLCCYIENEEPYYFSDKHEEEYKWYNKKWRQLVYFTKDIIVSGKSYPYHNDEISKALIGIIRDLAKKNLKWTYSFGPELYQDMKYICSTYSMDRAKEYIYYKNMKKHNIIFDTKGMYNDMLNDKNTKYWCIRNKVKHNQVISYSGKAPCLCCGSSVIEKDDYDYYDYNERYTNCGATVCAECLSGFKCDFCEQLEASVKHYKVFLEGEIEAVICEDCVTNYIKKCPDCGRPTFINHLFGFYSIFRDEEINAPQSFIQIDSSVDNTEFEKVVSTEEEMLNHRFHTIYPICRCGECAKKDREIEKIIIICLKK